MEITGKYPTVSQPKTFTNFYLPIVVGTAAIALLLLNLMKGCGPAPQPLFVGNDTTVTVKYDTTVIATAVHDTVTRYLRAGTTRIIRDTILQPSHDKRQAETFTAELDTMLIAADVWRVSYHTDTADASPWEITWRPTMQNTTQITTERSVTVHDTVQLPPIVEPQSLGATSAWVSVGTVLGIILGHYAIK